MKLITYPPNSVIYKEGEVPQSIYYIVNGSISTKLFRKEKQIESGTISEWGIYNIPSEESVVTLSETTLYSVNPSEILSSEYSDRILRSMVSSIAQRLLVIDSELAESREIPEYVGPDKLRFFNRLHPGAYKLTDNIFQDILQAKRFYVGGYYREAMEIFAKMMAQVTNEELKKEIMVWHTLLSMLTDPERAEIHFKRLNPNEYGDLLSYVYLVNFFKGGQKQEILEMYMKAGLFVPANTIVTLEGEAALEGYLILKGYLKAVKLFEDKEILLSIVGPGEFVGEGAFLDSKVRMVTLYTLSPTAFIPLNAEVINKTITTNPGFILKICESQLRRISQVKRLLEIRYQSNPAQRTISALKYFSELFGKTKITVRDIAYLVDVNSERVIEEAKHLGFKVSFDGTIIS